MGGDTKPIARVPPAMYGYMSSFGFVATWQMVGTVVGWILDAVGAEATVAGALGSVGSAVTADSPFPQRFALAGVLILGELLLVHWAALNVNKARMRFDVKWPTMYAPAGHAHEVAFNCYQRAHQLLLEYRVTFFAPLLLATAGGYGATAFFFGAAYLLSRLIFCLGYYTGDPQNKQRGDFGYFALFTLFGLSWRTVFTWLFPAVMGVSE